MIKGLDRYKMDNRAPDFTAVGDHRLSSTTEPALFVHNVSPEYVDITAYEGFINGYTAKHTRIGRGDACALVEHLIEHFDMTVKQERKVTHRVTVW